MDFPKPFTKKVKLDAALGGLNALGANPRNPRNRFQIRVRCCSCRQSIVT